MIWPCHSVDVWEPHLKSQTNRYTENLFTWLSEDFLTEFAGFYDNPAIDLIEIENSVCLTHWPKASRVGKFRGSESSANLPDVQEPFRGTGSSVVSIDRWRGKRRRKMINNNDFSIKSLSKRSMLVGHFSIIDYLLFFGWAPEWQEGERGRASNIKNRFLFVFLLLLLFFDRNAFKRGIFLFVFCDAAWPEHERRVTESKVNYFLVATESCFEKSCSRCNIVRWP